MTTEHDEGCLDKDWLAAGAVFWCRIDLDGENSAMMACPAMSEAYDIDGLLDEVFAEMFGEADPRYISEKKIARVVKQICMRPPAEREEWFDLLESFLAVSHVSWNVDAWAKEEGREPPPDPRYLEDRRAADEPSPLMVIPVEFTARLLWSVKAVYSRAASGNWDAFARMPGQSRENDMPEEVEQQLDDIMREDDGGEPETD